MGHLGRHAQHTRHARSAIVLALGSPLLWTRLRGRPLLAWAVAAFEQTASIGEVLLVVTALRVAQARSIAESAGWRKTCVIGTRRAGLGSALRLGRDTLAGCTPEHPAPPGGGLIVIHEACRPLVTPELIEAAIVAAPETGASVGAEPVKETIKRVRGGLIVQTLSRERLLRAQTPVVLARAHLDTLLPLLPASSAATHLSRDVAGALITVAIAAGIPVATYPGSAENIRVRTADDLAVAEALLP